MTERAPVDRAVAFLDDILAEPETLAGLLDAYDGPNSPLRAIQPRLAEPGRRVLFVGMGSSGYAAMDAAAALRAAGVAAWTEHAGTDTPTPPAVDLTVIAISASGTTAEVVETIEQHRGTSFVIGITNQPDGPVGARSDVVLPLLAGVEAAGVSCRTFQATNAVLALLAGGLGGRPELPASLRPAVDALVDVIDGRGTWLDQATDLLDRAGYVGAIGPGGWQGIAEQAALMLREGPRLQAGAHETGDWLHTAIYTALPGYRAILFPGSPHDAAVTGTIRGRGGAIVSIGDAGGEPASDGELRIAVPGTGRSITCRRLSASIVPELVSAALWARANGQVKGA
jgi:fructoselysine-6-P-deglycase FrlB-like protein